MGGGRCSPFRAVLHHGDADDPAHGLAHREDLEAAERVGDALEGLALGGGQGLGEEFEVEDEVDRRDHRSDRVDEPARVRVRVSRAVA